jgi:hypothetical protein
MWWWDFEKEEPLQEDLVAYEKFTEIRRERQKMNQDKERQQAQARSGKSSTGGTIYKIPDPT